MDLELKLESGEAQALLHVSGRLTAGDAQMLLRETLDPVLEQGFERVVLDLAQVSYLDSAGLGELLRARARAVEHGTALAVRAPSAQVASVLHLTGLDAILTDRPDPRSPRAQGPDATSSVSE